MAPSDESMRESRTVALTPLRILGLVVGLILSYIVKDAYFLSLNFEFASGALIYPDLMLIFLVFVSLHYSTFASIWFGFATGLLEDGSNFILTEGGEFYFLSGVHSLVYCILAFFISQIQGVVNQKSLISIMGIILLTSLVGRSSIWLLQGLFDQFNRNYVIVGAAIYTALVSPILFTALHWIFVAQFKIRRQ